MPTTGLLNHRSIFFFFSAGLLLICFLALKFAWISADAPYYLTLARHLSAGEALYKDVMNDYTPLVIYFFSIFYWFADNPNYLIFLTGQLLVILFSGLLVYRNLRLYQVDYWCSAMTAAAYCLALISSDGNYINLESFSVFFVLLAIYVVNRWQIYFLAGILLGFSFLCKQYGVLNFIPFVFLILISPISLALKTKRMVALGVGGLLVFLLFLAYYQFYENARIPDLLSQISGSSYSRYSIERQRSLLSVLIGAKVFLLFVALLVYILVVLRKMNGVDWFYLTGIIFCLVPVVLQGFQHYFINTFPYLFVWLGLLINRLQGRHVRITNVALLVVVLITSSVLIKRLFHYAPANAIQRSTSLKLSASLPAGSDVFIDGSLRYLYVSNSYNNPLRATVGFDYTYPVVTLLTGSKFDYVIISSKKYDEVDPAVHRREIETESGMVYLYSR